jgi:hypothetical protein
MQSLGKMYISVVLTRVIRIGTIVLYRVKERIKTINLDNTYF